ncbi:hypothetical protein PHYBLDRAFT_149815 [Phycomyces blakesleeanus NRRL 1555(-)]|uniref:Uncharacterized protein n=1 Tax=Phycomyces blakesleeanus (strain ATCC 8743b / DSM 1359 / FGSC 10004 / NBRC 33097 / NRRL 1555) TaxID=763407 RepID=A0A162ZW44_PHYB8|nr:hypothetical protein PHYBLDRAFT_149815 [Phycomyces blakesleeanus NRRL 1555(-)]OAD69421.1 hypothetical protein PHYBLDRAFT_149815 [Phycomyces blakesleeanus NRRL 1555(-)]|eukprot:XP_018287461.1 hypothetical protein PHYBLDRAFT_149815 [Phycomyces blakesleeanus NRRL 1555(-)]
MFLSDEDRSLVIWINEKLPSQNYCIFTAELSSFNLVLSSFAFGFQSLSQIALMTISKSVCLDATHGISVRSAEVLYSLVIWHPETGKGISIAYMITNDHTFLRSMLSQQHHLKQQSIFVSFMFFVLEFKQQIQQEQQFLNYFEQRWVGSDEVIRRWGRPYVTQQHL